MTSWSDPRTRVSSPQETLWRLWEESHDPKALLAWSRVLDRSQKCLDCGRVDGRTVAGGLKCHDCLEDPDDAEMMGMEPGLDY